MKTLMAIMAVLAMASFAYALECPDSVTPLWNTSDQDFGATYTCTETDGTAFDGYYEVVPAGTSIQDVVKRMTGASTISELIESLTGQKCIQIDNPNTGELRRIICQPSK
jgi:hypothetical protein